MNVSSTLEPCAGSAGRMKTERNRDAGQRRHEQVQDDCATHHDAEREVGVRPTAKSRR